MTISLCMIVKDEATTLAATLDSARPWVDEMVVVDTGSTDATPAVARAGGAQVYEFPWGDDFAAARNASLARATGDWVLVLDADEVLLPATGQVLKDLDQGHPLGETVATDVLAINLLRLELGAPQAPYTLITRFFRRLPTVSFYRPYHETVDDSLAALQAQDQRWQVITLTTVALHHRGYDPAVVAQRGKFERARRTMETYLASHPDDAYLANKLAALYIQSGQTDQALNLLREALVQAPSLDPITRYELYYHRALARADSDPALASQDYGLALAQTVPPCLTLGALINLGSLKKAEGDLTAALALFDQAIAIDPNLAIAHYNRGATQRARGYLEPAIAAYQRAIELDPDYAQAYQNLGVALFKLGKLPEALEAFGQALHRYQRHDPDYAVTLRQGIQQLGIPRELLLQAHLL
jgi:tetratricopeptide (TPR) repeat protein